MTSEVMFCAIIATMLIRNATLPDGRSGQDVLVHEGRIAAIGPALQAPPDAQVIDA